MFGRCGPAAIFLSSASSFFEISSSFLFTFSSATGVHAASARLAVKTEVNFTGCSFSWMGWKREEGGGCTAKRNQREVLDALLAGFHDDLVVIIVGLHALGDGVVCLLQLFVDDALEVLDRLRTREIAPVDVERWGPAD